MSQKKIQEFMKRREETMMDMMQTSAAAEYGDLLEASHALDHSYAPAAPSPTPMARLSRGSSYSPASDD